LSPYQAVLIRALPYFPYTYLDKTRRFFLLTILVEEAESIEKRWVMANYFISICVMLDFLLVIAFFV